MSGFSLLSLPPRHLEKVINKLQDKSYFRLQQTCWSAYDFIRNTGRISIYTDGYFELYFDSESASWQFYYRRPIAMRNLYGTRLRLVFSGYREVIKQDQFEKLWNLFKMHKITCVTVSIYLDRSVVDAGKDVELLKLLKPAKIYAHNEHLGLATAQLGDLEALSQLTTLKQVDIALGIESSDRIPVERLLSSIEEIKIRISQGPSDPMILLRTILEVRNFFIVYPCVFQSLLSTPFPIARLFKLDIKKIGWSTGNEALEEVPLPGFNLTVVAKSPTSLTADVILPSHFPPGSSCKIFICIPDYRLCYNSG